MNQRNIYKTVSILAKRSIQINEELRTELFEKLEEFATPIETLEEIFENKEQIEVSRFYEKLPSPTLLLTVVSRKNILSSY